MPWGWSRVEPNPPNIRASKICRSTVDSRQLKLSVDVASIQKHARCDLIVDWLNPVLVARMRLDQCVAPSSLLSVSRTTSRPSRHDLTRCSRTRLISQPNHFLRRCETVAPETHGKPLVRNFAPPLRIAPPATLQNDTSSKRYRPSAARLPRYASKLGPLLCAHYHHCFWVVPDEAPCSP